MQQFVGGQIDHLNLICIFKNLIRHCFSNHDACDLRNGFRAAFQVLNIQCCIDTDAIFQDFQDILVSFGMTAPGGIRVSQFIDQYNLGFTGNDGIQVHFPDGS